METDSKPLVTVVLTCFNQERFVEPCLESVKRQDYPHIELILVDNGSSDLSQKIIEDWLRKQRSDFAAKVILRKSPMPYCQSFNEAFTSAKGRYLIDLSGDDMLMPEHISRSVQKMKESIGVACCFSDIWLQHRSGKKSTFFKRDKDGHLAQKVKIGDIYRQLVERYRVPSVSLVFDADIFRKDGGYDEDLSYEDFDIMVRLARKYAFVFSNHIGVVKNIHSASFSAGQYSQRNSQMLPSTLKVCWKIKEMNRRPKENDALLSRVYHEAKHALWSGNFDIAGGFIELAERLGGKGLKHNLFKSWSSAKVNVSPVYRLFR